MTEWTRVPQKSLSRQSSEQEKRESEPSRTKSDENARRRVRNAMVNADEDGRPEKKKAKNKAKGAASKSPPDPFYYDFSLNDSYTQPVYRSLGKRWKDFAREGLGLSEADLDDVEVKHPANLKRQCDSAIQLWERRRSKSTVGHFIKALRSADENSLAETVEELSKSSVDRRPSISAQDISSANSLVDDLKTKQIVFLSKSIPADMKAKLTDSKIPFSRKTLVDDLSQIDALVVIVNGAISPDVKATLEKAEEYFLDGNLRIVTILADSKAEVPEVLCSTAVLRYHSETKKKFLECLHKCLCESANPVTVGPYTPVSNGWCPPGGQVRDGATPGDNATEPHYILCVRSFWGHHMLRKIMSESLEQTLFHIIVAVVFLTQCALAVADSLAEDSMRLFLMNSFAKAFFRIVFVIPCLYKTIATLHVSRTEWSKWKVQFSSSHIPQLKLLYDSKIHDEAKYSKLNSNNTVRHVYRQLDSDLTLLLRSHFTHCLFEVSLLIFLDFLDYPVIDSPFWKVIIRFIDVFGIFTSLLIFHVAFALFAFDMKMADYYGGLAKQSSLPKKKEETLLNTWKRLITASIYMACFVLLLLVIIPQSHISRPPSEEYDEKMTTLVLFIMVLADIFTGCNNSSTWRYIFPGKTILTVLALITSFAVTPHPSTRGDFVFIALTTGRLISLIIWNWRFSVKTNGVTFHWRHLLHLLLVVLLLLLLVVRVCGYSFF